MSLYAGLGETNITPPPGVWMSGYAQRTTGAVGVHDELYARALVLENGAVRVALIVADLIALDPATVTQVRAGIATQVGVPPEATLLHATHTHGGPNVGIYHQMGQPDAAYLDLLTRKLVGVAKQAADHLQPAHLTYGEASAQIGVNRRQSRPDGRVVLGADYGGPVAPLVQSLCVHRADGRLFALLCCHACHPTTLSGDNLQITAEWPGAAAAHLKARFRTEAAEMGIAEDALPFCLQGCGGDINPLRRGTWEAVDANGRQIAEAAHTARWNAHGRLDETLHAAEVTLDLPLLSGPDAPASHPFTLHHLNLGGVHLLGFPAEMFVQYQLDFTAQSAAPVLSLGYTNGCWNYVPTAAEYAWGGYEVTEAHKYYGLPMFAPDCERQIREAAYRLLSIESPERIPYPLQHGRAY